MPLLVQLSSWLSDQCCEPTIVQTKVVSRLHATVKFGASLLASDRTPIHTAVQEADLEMPDAIEVLNQHFGHQVWSPSHATSPSSRDNSDEKKRKTRSRSSSLSRMPSTEISRNVRVKADIERERQNSLVIDEEEALAANLGRRQKKLLADLIGKQAIAGFSDEEDDSEDSDELDPISRKELKFMAMQHVTQKKAQEAQAKLNAPQQRRSPDQVPFHFMHSC